jgi:hypothetical protein
MPPRAASQLAERAGLSAYAPTPTSDPPTDNTETQRLLRLLLTIYTYVPPSFFPKILLSSWHRRTTPSPAAETAAANLLATHASSFDAPDVLTTLPPHWPLRALSPYLVCALRSAAHTSHERALVKALAAGQNLAVADVAHAQLRAAGALVEEAASDDDDGEELVLDEKEALAASVIGKTEHAAAGADVVVGSWMSGRSSATNASGGNGNTPR